MASKDTLSSLLTLISDYSSIDKDPTGSTFLSNYNTNFPKLSAEVYNEGLEAGKKSTTAGNVNTYSSSLDEDLNTKKERLINVCKHNSSELNKKLDSDTVETMYYKQKKAAMYDQIAIDLGSLDGVYATAAKEGYNKKLEEDANKAIASAVAAAPREASTISNFDPREFIDALYNTETFKPYLTACVYADAYSSFKSIDGKSANVKIDLRDNVPIKDASNNVLYYVNDIRPLFQSVSGVKSPQIEISYSAKNPAPLQFEPFNDSKEITLTFLEDNIFSVFYTFKKIQENLVSFGTKQFYVVGDPTRIKYKEIVIGFFDYANIDTSDTDLRNLYVSNIVNNRLQMIGYLSLQDNFIKKVDNQNFVNPDATKTDGVSKTVVTLIPTKTVLALRKPKDKSTYTTPSFGNFETFTIN